jgi:flagellin
LVTAINGATWGSNTAVNASFDSATGILTLSSTAAINIGSGSVAESGFVDNASLGTSTPNAAASLTAIDIALSKVSTARATAGSNINRLGFALSNAQNVSQRLNEALSGLQDTDYAAESANLARGMVLAQAGTAMLAQANQAPQYVLTLLRG